MIATITADDDTELAPPARDDDGQYQHVLLYGAHQVAFADTLGELIKLIIPGYAALPQDPDGDARALIQRHDHLATVANAVQADYNTQAVERGLLDPGTTDENILTATTHDRAQPWPGVLTDDSDTPGFEWTEPFPIVLVATDYAPYVPERPTPTGAVVLLDPFDETTYLEALTRLGLVVYMPRS